MSNSVVEMVFTPHQPGPSGAHSADLSLFCKVLDTPPAIKWLGCLRSVLDANLPIEKYVLKREKVSGRFTGIPGWEKTAADFTYLINQCVKKINAYQANTIPLEANDRADQRLLNELHKYFEELRGPQMEPAAFFATAPEPIREALEDFNLYIHEYEGLLHSSNPGDKAAVDITFLGERMRPSMSPEDYRYFDLHREFGGLYLHYSEVGKPVLSVFEDKDEVVGLHNFRPLEHVSASFDIYFGESTKYRYDLEFRMRLHKWLRSLDLDPLDPKLCLGYVKVGQVILDNRFAGMSRMQFLEYFSRFLTLKRIVLH
jgi:hypothetical protein